MIYVVSQGESAIVKIGRGGNPKKRVAELQTGSPAPLLLLWTCDGDEKLESHLHAVFGEYRVRGEWFDLTPLGDAVAAVQSAVAEAPASLLKAPRFRGPAVVHPADKAAARLLSWEERFPPPRLPTVRPAPKLGCIRAWKGECLRPADMLCDC